MKKIIKPALFFFIIIAWPFKLLGKIFLKLVLVNLYHLYLFLKNISLKITKPLQSNPPNWLFKIGPLIIFVLIASWAIIDQWQLKKLTAEEIGKNTILDLIVVNQEEYETDETIVEGPIVNEKTDKLSYLEGEVLQAVPPSPKDFSQGLAFTTQNESVLISSETTSPGGVLTRTEIIDYPVQSGDTIGTIAQKFGININTVLWSNNLSYYSLIKPGQILKILPLSGISHQVKSGENLNSIAKKYQADVDKIIEFNKLASATDIRAGQNLIIPEGIKPVTYTPRAPATIKNIFIPPASSTNTRLLWPIASKYITQYFTWRHSGLDIATKMGTPIYAAENGKVERAGWTSGYGYNVVINHGNGIKTLYGHASKLYVSVGDSVSRGQVIAAVGSTGWSTGPHVHFEVRVNGAKKNPLNYIR